MGLRGVTAVLAFMAFAGCDSQTEVAEERATKRQGIVAMPADSAFVPFECGGTSANDAVQELPGPGDHRDIVGDSTFPALYRYVDANFLYVRMRLNGDPVQAPGNLKSFGWGVLFDTNNDATNYEYAFQVNGTGADIVTWCSNSTTTALGSSTDPCDQPALQTYPTPLTNYWDSRVAADGSQFSGTTDYWFTVALPIADLTAAGISISDPLRIWAGSTTSNQALNQDLTCNNSPTNALTDADTDPAPLDPTGMFTPDTTIVTQPSNPSNTSTGTFTYSCTNACTNYDCSVDGAAWTDCTPGASFTTAALADGPHTFAVRARKTSPIATDQTPATFSWTVNAAAPETTIESGPAPVDGATATFDFSSNEPGVTFECSLDNGPFLPCTDPATFTNLSAGSHTLSVRAKDAGGTVDGSPATWTWTVDLTAPETTIVGAPPALTNSADATFDFSSDVMGVSYECSFDGVNFAPCSDPLMVTGLPDGTHTLSVRAVDGMGKRDPAPATHTWTIDTTPPETTFAAPPPGIVSSSITFDFSSEPGATFECSIDGGLFGPCDDPLTLSGLADGSHTIEVRAKDAAGNVDGSPLTWSWVVDTTPPETTIDSGPPMVTLATDATIEFSSDDAAASFECALDGGAWTACTSPATFTNLAVGNHEVAVRAIDAAGNVDATPATRTWIVGMMGDTDADGLPDSVEVMLGTDPMDPDSDDDGLLDGAEDRNHNGTIDAGETSPFDPDTDDDGLLDGIEDENRDGVVNPGETDPLNPDTDADGLLDGIEDENKDGDVDPGETDPLVPDTDGDGLLDGIEDENKDGDVDPGETDPLVSDTDGDGLLDGIEDKNKDGDVDPGETDPLVPDTDGDGLPDGVEDRNGNGVLDPGETDPLVPDTDGDGLPDGVEDRNGNGLVDPGESDPSNPDTDGDGSLDGAETSAGSDPLTPEVISFQGGGCGCAASAGPSGSALWLGAGLLAMVARSRRRARR